MPAYLLNRYATFVESHLIIDNPEYALFHRLTGRLVQLGAHLNDLRTALKRGAIVALEPETLRRFGESGRDIQQLIDTEILIAAETNPWSSVADFFVVRPLQNPAVTYQDEHGRTILVSLSMNEKVYSPGLNDLPDITEEEIGPMANAILAAADGTRTVRKIQQSLEKTGSDSEANRDFQAAIDFLTQPERQLIKLAPPGADLDDPFLPFNTVPRTFVHAARWPSDPQARPAVGDLSIKEFHRRGIDDATWEFDIVEPTVNHALRSPSALLGGLDYGSRFWRALISSDLLNSRSTESLSVLEVGGGTGSFARSFISEAQHSRRLRYHILDLSPALIAAQRRNLSDVAAAVEHFHQDATAFELPQRFDLILANEVIADFPVAPVVGSALNQAEAFTGDGAHYITEFGLSVADAPGRFYLNSGVFQFLQRAWLHLKEGGSLILSEYGSVSNYPAESFHLNHSEFSIHFGHLCECARKIGFECRLTTLAQFLSIDDTRKVLNGREEHLMCLRQALAKQGMVVPFELFSEEDFLRRYQSAIRQVKLSPIRFLPLNRGFHYGPRIADFLVLTMMKPVRRGKT